MAAETVSAGTGNGAHIDPGRRVLFERFAWHDVPHHARPALPAQYLADFASTVKDVVGGVETLMRIAERDSIDSDCGDGDGNPLPALLNAADHGHIERLCITALAMLHQEAELVLSEIKSAAEGEA